MTVTTTRPPCQPVMATRRFHNPSTLTIRDICAAGGAVAKLINRTQERTAVHGRIPVYRDTHGVVYFDIPHKWVTEAATHSVDLVVPTPGGADEIWIKQDEGFTWGIRRRRDCDLPYGLQQQPLYIRFPDPTDRAIELLLDIGAHRIRRYIDPDTGQPDEVWQLAASHITRALHIRCDSRFLGVVDGHTDVVHYDDATTWSFTVYDEAEIVVGNEHTAFTFADRGLTVWPNLRRFDSWEALASHTDDIAGMHVIADTTFPPPNILAVLGAVTVKLDGYIVPMTPRPIQ